MPGKNTTICPICHGELTLDDLNPLAAMVRDDEFHKALDAAMSKEREAMSAAVQRHQEELAKRDEQIAYLRDMRARLSTKMLGESLERHCEDEFNRIRAMAFPGAYFEKDNDASSGSKGDYIFRENDADGIEITSIMFEMKNEDMSTRVRHKNEDFFRELDKDRHAKGCEYAVLVSLLEPDNDFYNAGIADVSYRYPKMFVVRPQCFLTIIGLLRMAGLQAVEYKRQAVGMAARQAAFEEVEGRIDVFKAGFHKNCDTGQAKIQDAIANIDKIIASLNKTRDSLETAQRQFGLAAKKADGITAKKMLGRSVDL